MKTLQLSSINLSGIYFICIKYLTITILKHYYNNRGRKLCRFIFLIENDLVVVGK